MNSLYLQRIVGGFNRREDKAIGWIYNEFYPEVYSTISKRTNRSADTPDLVQDVFLKLFHYPGRFDRLQKIRSFLYRAAQNISLDYLRHQQVVRAGASEIERLYPEIAEDSLEAADAMAYHLNLIYRAVEKLPEKCRETFQLYFERNLSNGEIAKQIGLSEKTVANRKSMALKTLISHMLKRTRSFLLLLTSLL
jgi:RNA polymerase sigma-70 factor (ECF subfamily)